MAVERRPRKTAERPARGASSKKPAAGSAKPWAGRFGEPTDPLVERFTSSIATDLRMAEQDVRGSIAYVRALRRAGLLSPGEAETLSGGLTAVLRELVGGSFRPQASDEDVHMAVERRLTEIVGPVGGKVHTGRSRNDQVATDLRLWVRDEIDRLGSAIAGLTRALLTRARHDIDVVLPGYTHLQRAQPVLLAHHWLAYVEMLARDADRLSDCRRRVNVMPLGAGALAGSGFLIDRDALAAELGFERPSENSLDAVSDRDFVVEFLAAAALLAMHLSRLGEEIVLWSSEEFRFVVLPDAFATGSSMMPQKKNPDVAELVRGRTGRVYGALVSLLTTLKGLPLSYNRDLQEDKPPLFEAADLVRASVEMLAALLPHLRVAADRARSAAGGLALATELADYLVDKDLPFRQAHEVVGRVVASCVKHGRTLESLGAGELARFSEHFGKDAVERLSVEAAIARRSIRGGTARENVERRIAELEADPRFRAGATPPRARGGSDRARKR